MNISVIMATYNGEKYIEKQLDSIICQLHADDELIVSDDGSEDGTIQIVQRYMERHHNIVLTEGARSGSSMNFASAIPKCKGDIVLFSDQDDIWQKHKVAIIKSYFESHPDLLLVMHNADYCDSEGNVIEGNIFKQRNAKHGFIHNLIRSTYYGCCMGAKRDFLMTCIPIFGRKTPFDQYFSLIAEKRGKAGFIHQCLITHRYHGNNQSHALNQVDKLKYRVNLLLSVHKALKREKRNGE